MSNDTVRWLSLDDLHPHPDNPRVGLDEEVVSGIEAGLDDGFDPAHALIVRPADDGYEIIAGHHRKAAAERAGLTEVPCWIRDASDDDAYMGLVKTNLQGELSPLEIGLHALGKVERATGGRGQKGGLSEYAREIGRDKGNLVRLVQAAKVAQKGCNVTTVSPADLHDKTAHLASIHTLPESCWPEAVERLVDNGWSARDVRDRVSDAREGETDKQVAALFLGETSHRELRQIDSIVRATAGYLDDVSESLADEWRSWVRSEDPVDVKRVQAKRRELEDRAEDLKEKDDPEVPEVVLADPPWRYDFSRSDSRQVENQYPTASVEDIIAERPETAGDAVLFLWATAPKLPQALRVMEGWGFEYTTQAVWDKEKIGMGYWFRGQHELLLVGTKGSPSPPESEDRVSSVFREPRSDHSAKPGSVVEWVESAFPDRTKREMFAREQREGWLPAHGSRVEQEAA